MEEKNIYGFIDFEFMAYKRSLVVYLLIPLLSFELFFGAHPPHTESMSPSMPESFVIKSATVEITGGTVTTHILPRNGDDKGNAN
jgi:hypothetical protein